MHTATQLKSSDFSVRIGGAEATREELLPGWDQADRLGVVMDRPFGALGASHLIQLAITAFFDTQRSLVGEMFSYPDFYLFHFGGRYGSFSAFDFYPEHKEVFVGGSPMALLEAITDRAITRLVVVDPTAEAVEVSLDNNGRKVRSTAEYRVRSAFAYSSAGRARDADVSIRGSGETTEINTRRVLDPEALIAPPHGRDLAADGDVDYFVGRLRARANEASAADKARATTSRDALVEDGAHLESDRRIELEEALGMLWRMTPGR